MHYAPLLSFSGLPFWELTYQEQVDLRFFAHSFFGLFIFVICYYHPYMNAWHCQAVFNYTGFVVGKHQGVGNSLLI